MQCHKSTKLILHEKNMSASVSVSASTSKTTSTMKPQTSGSTWVLALQTYHAFVSPNELPSYEPPSIADEFYEVGVVLPDIKEKEKEQMKRKSNWLIPTKGTTEYADVSTIHHCLKTHSELESMARELLQIQKENNLMHQSLLQMNS